MKQITLPASNGSLDIEIVDAETNWSACYFNGKERIFLGSETLSYIIEHLMGWLSCAGSSSPKWILSLMEAHSSLYGIEESGCKQLLIQDARPALVQQLTLTPEECAHWLHNLSTFREFSLHASV